MRVRAIVVAGPDAPWSHRTSRAVRELLADWEPTQIASLSHQDDLTVLEVARRWGRAPLVLFAPYHGHDRGWPPSERRVFRRSLDGAARVVYAAAAPHKDAASQNQANALEWAGSEVHDGHLLLVLGRASPRIDELVVQALKAGLEVQQIR